MTTDVFDELGQSPLNPAARGHLPPLRLSRRARAPVAPVPFLLRHPVAGQSFPREHDLARSADLEARPWWPKRMPARLPIESFSLVARIDDLRRFAEAVVEADPGVGAALAELWKRPASSKAAATASAVIGPTPGALMNSRTVRLRRAAARTSPSSARIVRMAHRAATSASKIGRSSGATASSPSMISSARPMKPPTRRPKRTPKVFSRPRTSFSSRTRMATSASRSVPVRMICARPRASWRSVLLGIIFSAALARRSPPRPASTPTPTGAAPSPCRTVGLPPRLRRGLQSYPPAMSRLSRPLEVLTNQLGDNTRTGARAVAEIDAAVAALIAADPGCARKAAIPVSIPGLGAVTVAAILAEMPEIGTLDPGQASTGPRPRRARRPAPQSTCRRGRLRSAPRQGKALQARPHRRHAKAPRPRQRPHTRRPHMDPREVRMTSSASPTPRPHQGNWIGKGSGGLPGGPLVGRCPSSSGERLGGPGQAGTGDGASQAVKSCLARSV